jgi:hypothetical protein
VGTVLLVWGLPLNFVWRLLWWVGLVFGFDFLRELCFALLFDLFFFSLCLHLPFSCLPFFLFFCSSFFLFFCSFLLLYYYFLILYYYIIVILYYYIIIN